LFSRALSRADMERARARSLRMRVLEMQSLSLCGALVAQRPMGAGSLRAQFMKRPNGPGP
jgi:hypothetical protein